MLCETKVMGDENKSIQIGIRADANERINNLVKETGMKKVDVLSRALTWFADLPDIAKKSILWPPTNNREYEAMRLVLDHMRISGSLSESELKEFSRFAAEELENAHKRVEEQKRKSVRRDRDEGPK